MRKFFILLTLTCLPLSISAQTGEKLFNDASFKPLPQLTVNGKEGVSAPFAGMSGDWLIVAGGCNFPDVPAAEGGQKQFYKDVYALKNPLNGKEWKHIGTLPEPLAYGVSVSVPDGVLCVGGTSNGKESSNGVFLLSVNGNKLTTKELPSLPIGIDNMAGAYGEGYVYIVGGQTDGKGNKTIYRLQYPDGKAWEELAPMPGEARLQPAVAYQNGAVGCFLYVFGGFDSEQKCVHTDGMIYNPRTNEWQSAGEIVPFGTENTTTLIGATAVTSGAGHIICFGGVDKDIFEQAITNPQDDYLTHPAEWYKFRKEMLIYHTITGTWQTLFSNELNARAGAAVVPYKDATGQLTWIIVNGETKPGVRSADVTATSLHYTAKFGWLNWTVLVVYLIAMLLLGYYFMRRESGSEDFFKGGNRIPWWAAGISIFATMLSAITYMSIPAKAYATDWTYYPMQICILIVSFPVIKYYLPFFRRLNVTTAYEYLEHRFNYFTRLMASVLFIVFMVARMALVLFLPSLAMTAVTGINIYLCIVIMAVVTIIYCTMGGVEAVVWGDVVQGIILVGGAFLAAGYLIFNTGNGAGDFFQIAMDNDKFRLFDWSFDYRNATFWVVILGGLGNNLISYTSDQTVIQRYLTTKDEGSAARSILTNGIMSVVVTIAFFTIGTGLYTFYKTHPAAMDMTMQKTDAIFPFFMMSQLPAGIAGLLIAAVFAATMSTISSNINSISTAFTIDIYKKARKQVGDKETLRTARITGVVSGIIGMLIAILMATVNIQSLLDYFNTILGLLSGAIGGLFMMGIFFPRISARAALVGFVCGTATVFYMNYCTEANFLLFGFTSMAVSVVVALLLSFVWREDRKLKGFTWKTLEK